MERETPKERPHTNKGGFGKQPLPQDERALAYCSQYRRHPVETFNRRTKPQPQLLRPTTSFLTAATQIYALGAGITAGAGTRLVLQWMLSVRVFTNHYKLHVHKDGEVVIFRRCLTVSALGNLRACCWP